MMNSLIQWIDPDLVQALGWTLLHSLWQGGAIALLLAVGLIIMRKSSAAARYWVSMSSLLILLATTIFTFSMIYEPNEGSATIAPVYLTENWQQELPEAGLDLDAQPVLSAANHPTVYADYFEQHLPLLVTAWLLGVLLLCLRMLGEIAYIQHLKNYRCRAVGPRWLNRLQSMCEELNIRREVQLRETFRVHAPMVVGVFKPVILFPIGLLANLPTEQVESILAHELAHIRRHDYLINLFQALVEILLFFNPAMWWISGKIKAEREHSCDDLAINMTGDTIAFVKSLARLEEWRLQGQSVAMSFTGQQKGLLGRIQRLANREDKRKIPAKAFWSLSVVGFCMALLVFQTTPAESQTGVENVPVEEPVTEAVVEPNEEVEAPLEEVEPEEEISPEEGDMEEIGIEEVSFEVERDSVPEDLVKMEAEMVRIEKEMSAQMRDMQAKMRALQNEQLQKQKEIQVKMQAQQRRMMELSMNMQKMENDQQMLEQQFSIDESDLDMEELKLDQQREELEFKRQQLEEEADELSGDELKNRLKAVQESQRALLEKEKALHLRKHTREKQFKDEMIQREKAMRELEASQTELERTVEMMERDFEMEMLKFEQQQENMSVDQELLEREWEVRQEALEKRAEEVERQMESKRKQE